MKEKHEEDSLALHCGKIVDFGGNETVAVIDGICP